MAERYKLQYDCITLTFISHLTISAVIGDLQKPRTSSICNFINHSTTSCFLGPNVFLSFYFLSKFLYYMFLHKYKRQRSVHIQISSVIPKTKHVQSASNLFVGTNYFVYTMEGVTEGKTARSHNKETGYRVREPCYCNTALIVTTYQT
jgi:hypothetical protein